MLICFPNLDGFTFAVKSITFIELVHHHTVKVLSRKLVLQSCVKSGRNHCFCLCYKELFLCNTGGGANAAVFFDFSRVKLCLQFRV